MNFITYCGIVSLYGKATSERVGWYNGDGGLTRRDRRWIRKYGDRGYEIFLNSNTAQVRLGEHDCGTSARCTQTTRSLFDSGVYFYPFHQFSGVDKVMLLKKVAPWFIWRLKNQQCGDGGNPGSGFIATGSDYLRV
jgi:hypothetical protein